MRWLICFALLSPLGLVAQSPHSDAEKLWRDAGALFQRGLYWESESLFRQLTVQLPKNPKAHFGLGVSLLRSERPRAALESLERSLELSPKDAQTLLVLGTTQEALSRPDAAAEAYRRALAIIPNHVEIRFRAGALAAKQSKDALAIRHLRTAQKLSPKRVDVLTELAGLELRRRELGRARKLSKDALALDPKAPRPHYFLARIAALERKPKEAKAHLQRHKIARAQREARERAVAKAQTLVGLGYRAQRSQRRREALDHFRGALDHDPSSREARAALSRIMKSLSRSRVADREELIRLAKEALSSADQRLKAS